MQALGFFIPAGLVLTLIVALAGKPKTARAEPQLMPPIPPPEPIPPIPPPESMPPIPPPEPIPPIPPSESIPPIPPSESIPPVPPQGPILLNSPFPNVSNRQWSKFVQLMARGKEGTITKGARYGIFLFSVRRLADLGLVTNVKRGTYQGKTVWTGTWVPPYNESKFLTSSLLQYRAFTKSCMEYAKKYHAARQQNPALFRIKTKPLTLSGFLAFAHVAGFMGAINSLKSRKIRSDTLAFVERANGIF